MPEIENKLKWCLNKAKKEISEGRLHRGLVKIIPNIDEAKKHILKAEHNFKAINTFEKVNFSDWSVSAAFYTIYHCFLAIAYKFGYESRNQECTIALIASLIEDKKISLSKEIVDALKFSDHEERHERSVIELRENFQYGSATKIEDTTLAKLKEICKTAIDETKKIVY